MSEELKVYALRLPCSWLSLPLNFSFMITVSRCRATLRHQEFGWFVTLLLLYATLHMESASSVVQQRSQTISLGSAADNAPRADARLADPD